MDAKEAPQFELEPDEEYDKFCGKVFLTTKRNIILHCILCETKYHGFESYVQHIESQHFMDANESLDEEEFLECDGYLVESENEDMKFSMYEEELPIKLLQNKTKISVHKETTQDLNDPNITTSCDKSSERVEINAIDEALPTEIEDRSRRTQIVTSEKGVFKCPCCPQRFLLEYAWRAHVKIHDKDRTFKCKICGILCKTNALLRVHLRRHAKHKPHKCTECERSFVHPSELQYHMRNHNGEKPYQCEDCGARYAYKSTLRMHRKRQHTFEKDYHCAICNKAFYSTVALRDHSYKHTKESTYECEICGKKNNSYSSFTFHKSKHHKAAREIKNSTSAQTSEIAVIETSK